MKVGDLVQGRLLINHELGTSARDSHGITIDSYESDDGVLYFEVQWFDDDRMWYDELELKVISEAR